MRYKKAQLLIGNIYCGRIILGDLGSIVDFTEAEKWFLKVAAHGTGDALYKTGDFYLRWFYHGRTDCEKIAFEYFLQAGHLGHADSQAALGQHYRIASTFPSDYEASAFWYRKAATAGHMLAMFSLASDILYGGTTAQQPDEVAKLCRAVYEKELSEKEGVPILSGGAARMLYEVYQNGLGVPRNLREARIWQKRAIRFEQKQAPRGKR